MGRQIPAPTLAELKPMLLSERQTIPREPGWHFEIKYDGYRMLAATGQPSLKTKNGADATAWFPEIAATLAALPAGNILDGEVCVLDDIGRSDFERLQTRARRRGRRPGDDAVAYCVFDLLVSGGNDLRGLPIEKRKAALRRLLAGEPRGFLYVQAVGDGAWLYDAALRLGLEGVVGKRAGSTYQTGVRSPDWIKVKRPGAIPAQRFKR